MAKPLFKELSDAFTPCSEVIAENARLRKALSDICHLYSDGEEVSGSYLKAYEIAREALDE